MYAIVKTGGKQYRVEQGQSLLVERLPVDDGASVDLQPLLYVDGSEVVDGVDGVTVSARVLAHERGPKLRIVKFKPKRGYKRRTGHRQELTRIEVTEIKLGSGGAARKSKAAASKPEPTAAEPAAAAAAPVAADTPAVTSAPAPAGEPAASAEPTPAAAHPAAAQPPEPEAPEPEAAPETTEEASDGS
jgi:large subunit ribosomal protein L21